ncbi:MAG: IS4 family transposase [Pseudonocardiaceae bacterium]
MNGHFDLPDTDENTEEFGTPSGGVYPQARVVTLVECGSHVSLGAQIGPVVGKGTGERSAAAELIGQLEPDMMLICDQGFYSFTLWCQAAGTGAALVWRLGDIMDLPVVERCGDGSFLTVLFAPGTSPARRRALLVAAKAGHVLDPDRARLARVVEYEVTDRGSGDLICLLTTILDPREAPALILAECYHQRWEHEGANKEVKTRLRGPGKILRSKTPDMVRQEIYGYLIAHYAVSAMICRAATETGIDPDRVKFTQTVRLIRDTVAGPDGFSPDHQHQLYTELATEITAKRHLNPIRHRSNPRVVTQARHNSFPVKRPGDKGTRHNGPATIHLANQSYINPTPTPTTRKRQVTALATTS